MTFCKNFLHGIRTINFTSSLALTIKRTLFVCAQAEMSHKLQSLRAKLTPLEKAVGHDPAMAHLNQTLTAELQQHQGLSNQLAQEAPGAQESTEPFNEEFICHFAGYFQDLHHLAYVLSDAPAAIKRHQTALYGEVLGKLSQSKQEEQIKHLTTHALMDLIEHAVQEYNEATDEKKGNYQQIAQMALFELLRQATESFLQSFGAEAPENAPTHYAQFFDQLSRKIPNVNRSTIFDNFSAYHATTGISAHDLLKTIDAKLPLAATSNWLEPTMVTLAKAKRQLCNTLRFGQEARREYIRKRETNLIYDLFAARTIRDTEVYQADGISDALYHTLTLRCYFEKKQSQNAVETSENFAENKLIAAITAFKQRYREAGLPGNTPLATMNAAEKDKFITLLKKAIHEARARPHIECAANGQIKLTFFYYPLSNNAIEDTITLIQFYLGGFAALPRNIVNKLLSIQATLPTTTLLPKEAIHTLSLSGGSFADLYQQLAQQERLQATPVKISQKTASPYAFYKKTLERLEQNYQETFPALNQLNLSPHQELLLRQLLELQDYYATHPSQRPSPLLAQVFGLLTNCQIEAALRLEGVETALEAAYQGIAEQPADHPLIEKIQALLDSKEKRKARTALLETIFQQPLTETERAQQLSALFIDEYTEMQDALGITDEAMPRLLTQITAMAKEFAHLQGRVQAGIPIFTDAEEEAYFAAIQQIAAKLEDVQLTLADVHFKVKQGASSQRVRCYTQSGDVIRLDLELNTPLPYSLIKAPGASDFIFSFGGTRGFNAPFDHLEALYKGPNQQKGRLFTANRILGVGQYGTAKAVENLLQGLNQVIKQGYIATGEPTFTPEATHNLRTRAITSRNDPTYQRECDVLRALSTVNYLETPALSWITADSPRPVKRVTANQPSISSLFATTWNHQYKILQPLATGKRLTDDPRFANTDPRYHDPLQRNLDYLSSFTEQLKIAQAIVQEAQRFEMPFPEEKHFGFAHNDLKPENLLVKKHLDGHYSVQFIDWATGDFILPYKGSSRNLADVFKEIFAKEPDRILEHGYADTEGRFVMESETSGQIIYGLKQELEILNGLYQGTLPYISPRVLAANAEKQASSSSSTAFALNTNADNWALTALTFGICNRRAYFSLVKGRIVNDYEIPGILAADGKEPAGLAILNAEKFNAFFACEISDRIDTPRLDDGTAYFQEEAVMFIPSNAREAEPLHLYRYLQFLRKKCMEEENSQALAIAKKISDLLVTVHTVVAQGEAFEKARLLDLLAIAASCIQDYQNLTNSDYQEALKKQHLFAAILQEVQTLPDLANDILAYHEASLRKLTILATYPQENNEKTAAKACLEQLYTNSTVFHDHFLQRGEQLPPAYFLFRDCIAAGQTEILLTLLTQVPPNCPEWIALVSAQGLIHFALQENNPIAVSHLITALQRAGATLQTITDLIAQTYSAAAKEASLHWAVNALEIAIRNHDLQGLALLCENFTTCNNQVESLLQNALHLSALLSQVDLFAYLLNKYRTLKSEPISIKTILNLKFPPDQYSPYHLFLRDEKTIAAIDWSHLRCDRQAAREFLLSNALLVAAEHNNLAGFEALLALGDECLEASEWIKLFTQYDEEGKTLLNYWLENEQYTYLETFFKHIRSRCPDAENKVLIPLLTHPNPFNPLKNFLASAHTVDQQFAVLNQLLEALNTAEIASEKELSALQRTRIITLLVNNTWLNQRAVESDSRLTTLLQSSALHTANKQYLLTQLIKHSDGQAQAYYQELLRQFGQEIINHEMASTEQMNLDLLEAVALLGGDWHQYINLFKNKVTALQTQINELHREREQWVAANAELSTKNAQLHSENNELKQTKQSLEAQILAFAEIEKTAFLTLQKQLEADFQEVLSTGTKILNSEAKCLKDQSAFIAYLEGQANQIILAWEQAELTQYPAKLATEKQQYQNSREALIQQWNPEAPKVGLLLQLKRQQFLIANQIEKHFHIIRTKANEPNLARRDPKKYAAAQDLCTRLQMAKQEFLQTGEVEHFKKTCQNAVSRHQKTFCHHTDWSTIFANFLTAILSLGITVMACKFTTGRWTLFRTDTDQKTTQFITAVNPLK